MGSKPNDSLLMDYLYGNLSQEEAKRVEEYLQEDPSLSKEMEEYRGIRKMLGKAQDREVPHPILVPLTGPKSFWQEPFFRYAATIALFLGFLMVLGKFTGLDLQFREFVFSVSFQEGNAPEGEREAERRDFDMTLAQVMEKKLRTQEVALENILRQQLREHRKIWQQEMQQERALTDRSLIKLAENLQEQSQIMAEAYRRDLLVSQEHYYTALLDNLVVALQQMREEDRLYLQAWMAGLESDKEAFQQETEEILASLLYTVGNYQHE